MGIMDCCCFNNSLCHKWFFTPSSIVQCLCFPNRSGRQIGYTNIEETIQYSSFCNLVFINEIYLVSLRKCAKIKIALSVQIEKCAKYLQHQYIPIYSIYLPHLETWFIFKNSNRQYP